jgi:hypothetical protein
MVPKVPRYRFNIRHGELLIPDSAGEELRDAEAAREEATHVLAEIARSGSLDPNLQVLAVEVVDDSDRRLFSVRMVFEMAPPVTGR